MTISIALAIVSVVILAAGGRRHRVASVVIVAVLWAVLLNGHQIHVYLAHHLTF